MNDDKLLFTNKLYVKHNDKNRWTMEFYPVYGLKTLCILTDLRTGKTRVGISKFNPDDVNKYEYDISTGRKYALAHAIENSEIPVEIAFLFFEELFKTHNRVDVWERKENENYRKENKNGRKKRYSKDLRRPRR